MTTTATDSTVESQLPMGQELVAVIERWLLEPHYTSYQWAGISGCNREVADLSLTIVHCNGCIREVAAL